MKHKIEINYNTGNSFNTERGVKDTLDLEWDDLNVAKENLKRIKEHYTLYKELNSYFSDRDTHEVLADMTHQRWWGNDDSNIKLINYMLFGQDILRVSMEQKLFR